MKILFLLAGVMVFAAACGQTKSKDDTIASTIKRYSQSGDWQDAATLQEILHEQHRLVLNDGENTPFVLDKNGYVEKIKSKEWGGDMRKVTIESVNSFGEANATVQAVLDGEKTKMESLFSLVKVEGEWKIIQELVKATFK